MPNLIKNHFDSFDFCVWYMALIFLLCVLGCKSTPAPKLEVINQPATWIETQGSDIIYEDPIELEEILPEVDSCEDLREQFHIEAPSLCEPLDRSRPFDHDPAPIVVRMQKVKVVALELGASERVATMLAEVIAVRESSAYPSQLHRMDADVKANRKSWYKRRDKIDNDAHRSRYFVGHGLYGHNTSLALARWGDWQAPPEILCDSYVATAIYLRAMRRAWHEYRGDLPRGERRIFCGGKRFYGSGHRGRHRRPTLADLHRYASGGKACPRPPEHRLERSFRRRMAGRKLKAHYTPEYSELGYELHNHEVLMLREGR